MDHNVATVDITEITQTLEQGLSQVGASGWVISQVAHSGDLGRLLGLNGNRAEHPDEGEGDDAGDEPDHLGPGHSNGSPPLSDWIRLPVSSSKPN
jgi:hypothetical protein